MVDPDTSASGEAPPRSAASGAAAAATTDERAAAPKTAILLIHGMGEQRPMATLWGFVDAIWSRDPNLVEDYNGEIYAKPDTINDNFELRRVTTRYWKGNPRRRVDFFEFYWAHMMRGNTIKSTVEWILGLFFRSPSSVPTGLRAVWLAGLVFLTAAIGLFIAATLPKDLAQALFDKPTLLILGIVSTLSGLFAARWLAPVAGDAARYFSPIPDNVEARQKIMRAGVDVIEKLARSGDYDRIIVVGHSLGSAIGLDILYQAFGRVAPRDWARVHKRKTVADALLALEKAAAKLEASKSETDLADYRVHQRDYAAALRDGWQTSEAPWLVSDFVTLGSPLSKANVLIAHDQTSFTDLADRRQIPTCPPKLEQHKPPRFSFPQGSVAIPHFAAVFAPSLWTNVYFPSRLIAFGDIISGPASPLFGPAVRDIRVPVIGLRFRHNDYWRLPALEPGREASPPPVWIDALRQAVNLRLAPEPGAPVLSAPPQATPREEA
ncbi:hypothetical protein [Sphingobium yanoikuyae]|uniref:hypothetical protein n=1 Tax=Sphingobium yanoikuyae TaxID=13690 RepID=UPI000262B742|nr:hypothetical protein [Sphingobium yanoikuyae]